MIALLVAVFVVPIIGLITLHLVSPSRRRSARNSEPPQPIVSPPVQEAKKTRRRRRRRSSSASAGSGTSTVKHVEPLTVEEKRTNPVNVATQNIKKITHTISQSLKPKSDSASFSKKVACKISKAFTPQRDDSSTSSLKPLRHLSSALTKSKNLPPALDMIREVSNGHCREVVLSEETLGMSRALSSNRAICTGW